MDIQEKPTLNFHGFWFFTLELTRDVTHYSKIYSDERLFCLEFLGVK